jgi:hypothetical protein
MSLISRPETQRSAGRCIAHAGSRFVSSAEEKRYGPTRKRVLRQVVLASCRCRSMAQIVTAHRALELQKTYNVLGSWDSIPRFRPNVKLRVGGTERRRCRKATLDVRLLTSGSKTFVASEVVGVLDQRVHAQLTFK